MAPDRGEFWAIEEDAEGPFRWTRRAFSVAVPDQDVAFATLRLASPIAENTLRVDAGGTLTELPLGEGWQTVDVATMGVERLSFVLAHTFEAGNGDRRELGVMLRDVLFHADAERHAKIGCRHENLALNDREFRAGTAEIVSVPPYLRITVSKTCNIANETACVYCSWDWAKRLEQGAPDQDAAFLNDLGRHLDLAWFVNDSSYGEPPLEQGFAEIIRIATDCERRFEFTSNGQTLSAKSRAQLHGKTALVHVSIDAASAAGYRRYRDHRFDLIIDNLRAFCRERAATGGKPQIFVSFILMRSNLGEIEDFLRLMMDVGVDRVTFRTLFLEDHIAARRSTHHGYAFDYEAECLTAAELAALATRCLELGTIVGVPVAIEWDEFVRNTGPTTSARPICSEPWKTSYVLNRGITPCCYGREPMVEWKDIDRGNLEESIGRALNSAPFRELRRDLSAGRLGNYCARAQSCPIVKAYRGAKVGARAD